ncbi:hypothetical protein [Martelella sp. FOR1707]
MIPRLTEYPVHAFRPTGTLVDLGAPDAAEIFFDQIAQGLSKIARFNGTAPGPAYSVAQHSVMGADALLNEGADHFTAALFLIHDAHEHLIGDWTRPAQQLIAATIRAESAEAANHFMLATARIKEGWDRAICHAAGLPPPEHWTNARHAAVHDMDNRMLRAEVQALFGPAAARTLPLSKPPKTRGAIKPWPPMKAEEKFNDMCRLLPIFAGQQPRAARV